MYDEKWSRKNYFEIPPYGHAQNYFFYFIKMPKTANSVIKNTYDPWRDFNKTFVMYVHIINETLSHKFHPYSI